MKWRIHRRDACRLCGAAAPRRFLHLPNMPLTDDFVTADQRGQEFAANLDVCFCAVCGSAQTQHDVEVGEYYRDYGYTVSGSPLAQRFMHELAAQTFERLALRPGDAVLEIGSGDGGQLACFKERGARVLGFEPSAELCRRSRAMGVDVVQGLFTADSIATIPADMRPAQIVLLTYTFDHLPEPRALLEAVRGVLDPQRGALLIEVHDLRKIITRHEACLFEHEHTIYLHAGSLARLLTSAGYRVLTTELVSESCRRGNSLLVAAALPSATHAADASAKATADATLAAWPTYLDFGRRVEKAHANLRQYVRNQRAAGRRVAGYGAGGRGVMTLAMTGLTANDLAYLCDRNTGIHGRYTPVSHVPVVPPEQVLADPVDEVVVFSYGYMEEIRAALRAYEARGGRFVSMLDLLR